MTDESIQSIATRVIEKYGWYVFPIFIKHNEKKCDGGTASCKDVQPLVQHWRIDSTNDINVLETLPWSKANAYGIDCGRSGILVADEDPGATWDGPETLTFGTGRGKHYIYEDVLGMKASYARVEPWGIDVKGVGGFIIGPGSYHPHGEYKKVHQADIALAPGALTARLVLASADTEPPEMGDVTELPATEARSRLKGVYKRMEEAQEGERNNVLNLMAATAAGILIRVAEDEQIGELREVRVKRLLTDAALKAGLDDAEIAGTLESGWKYGWNHPVGDEGPGGAIEKIFVTPTLQHIRQASQSRQVAPLAVLSTVLARLLVEVPPNYVLPGVIGNQASLNFAVGLVGESGEGKSASIGVSDELLGLDQGQFEQGLGSAEGVIEHYYEGTGNTRQIRLKPTQLMEIDEIDRLNTLDKKGTGIGAVIRTAVTGGHLKTGNATQDRRRNIIKHRYRFVLIAGIQPELASYLLDDVNAGTPQRFLWIPVWEEPDEILDEEPPWPGMLDVEIEDWVPGASLGDGMWNLDMAEMTEIEYPDWLVEEIKSANRARRKGEQDPLDGHRTLTRLRVAAALAILHGELKLSEQWWAISGEMMKISTKTQKKCFASIARAAEQKTLARYRMMGKGEVIKQIAIAEEEGRIEEEISERVLEILHEAGEPVSMRDMKNTKLSKKQRNAADKTIDDLVSAGLVVVEEIKPKTGRPKKVIRLATQEDAE